MSIGIPLPSTFRYQVSTPIYQGPLDLLLHLIEKAELDITQLALAQVTDQFLAYLQSLSELGKEEVSYFLIVATKLLYIKSQMLLPRPALELGNEEEDNGEDLLSQLREYKKFRQIATHLRERERQGLRTYIRLAAPPKPQRTFEISQLDLQAFLLAARNVFQDSLISSAPPTVIKPKYSIKEQISRIIDILKNHARTTFRQLIASAQNRNELIIVFLALLELVKQHQVEVHQPNLFDEIEIYPTPQLFVNTDVETEFED
ncbi:MAG: segregation/condensation protein A [Anaerolineales bacterium]|nr:segregation/condensation protein A [Anaerolineales bacterium]MCS7247218.1 segregation/condensation protein A [Anaerolineales bacterium]MDW8161029.1 segregation/condensation protein A [Anaerolineales bacterium]MDW8445795.1 segregation/condensation protein A [Anaerolineales bacterium]